MKLLKMTFSKFSLPAELGKGNGFLEVSSSTWFYSSIIELGLDNPPQGPVLCLCAQERYFSVILARTTINMFTGGVSVMLNRKTNVLIAAFYLVVLKNKMVL